MPPPKDLPGFYFDQEKNRYFPIKGPIPGFKRPASSPGNSVSDGKDHDQVGITNDRKRLKTSELLLFRELNGRALTSGVRHYDFIQDYQKLQASNPSVCFYRSTASAADTAVRQLHGVVQTATGVKRSHLLATGSTTGFMRLYVVGDAGRYPNYGRADGGSINILNLSEPLEINPGAPGVNRRFSNIASFHCTIWTGDCNSNMTYAAVGTNLGAVLMNIETGKLSWAYRSKSDVLSQQFDQSGNIIFCGLRNGAIVPVDVRLKHHGNAQNTTRTPAHTSPSTQRTGFLPPIRHRNMTTRRRFEIQKDSNSASMSSSVCSLVTLKSNDLYLLGSSMDGSINLFDRRLLRIPVQSYEGHMNSHSHLQIGVDPSESFLISGGEDCFLRIWCIKSSELLFAKNLSSSPVSAICCSQTGNITYGTEGSNKQTDWYQESQWERGQSWRTWLGSHEGLFYMHGT
ncbi:hypothetical protein J5N97_027343 [Dioscorea zingiberensis]|uniref:Uncharacterized protein n=1 Tax=Dioscorea zingiberensis TaxID=325984 RepID=A0A9D5C4N3_9LILI|nr:hypothetical protein J5N97_027343 [Dioscorea zingiberensis]